MKILKNKDLLVNISSFINIQGLPDEQVEEQQNLAEPMLMKQMKWLILLKH